jgi:ubiquinone/menaquinone biosynthesis C-methylase UbiE
MTAEEPQAINHHADHPGFSGLTGAIVGVILLWMGRANARLAAEVTGVCAGDRVIDVGCGPGGAAQEAARRGASVVGVDPAPVMLRLARTFTRDAAVSWVNGTAEDVPLADGSATVLWSLATVHHWKDVGRGLEEARRLLAPNGRLLAVERRTQAGATGLASHGWTEQQAESFATQCRTAGFADVTVGQHGQGRRAVWTVSATRA